MSTSPSIEELERRIEQRVADREQERENRLATLEEAIRWMVAVPAWTPELASLCGFAMDDVRPKLLAEGLCLETRTHGVTRWWMPAEIRREQLERLLARSGGTARDELRRRAVQVARWLDPELEAQRLRVPETIRYWVELLRGASYGHEVAKVLSEQVRALLEEALRLQGRTDVAHGASEERMAEAMGRISVARQFIAPIFGPETLAAAIATASWRIEFLQLRLEDERRLASYVEREEQDQVFEALAATPDGAKVPWALHYVGKAGLGKTMLARHLCARVIPRFSGAAWARVDFDHLDPVYPSCEPWLLLDVLAEQLRLQDTTGIVAKELGWYDSQRLNLREYAPVLDSWAAIREHSVWHSLIGAFANALRAFPSPVFLLFDTCEELAKLEPGAVPTNVAATFEILETLHAQVPSIRVLFFGRRPLASSGAGWTLKDAPEWLPERPYLRLYRMRGFTEAEARGCFTRIVGEGAPARLEAVLRKTREPSGPSRFTVVGQANDDTPRFHPFEVALIAEWIRVDPNVTPEVINNFDSERYVQMRIIDRLRSPRLVRLLPAVALLGTFDEALLRATWEGNAEDFDAVFSDLIREEWVSREGGHVQVDAALLPRLLAYFQKRERATLERARALASTYLERFTRDEPFARVPRFHYTLLARLLREDPEVATRWWEAIEKRVADEGLFLEIGDVCAELLAEEGPLPPTVGKELASVRAAVLATYASSQMHAGQKAEKTWTEVQRFAPLDATRLRLRARLGRIPSAQPADEAFWTWMDTLPEDVWDEQTVAAFVAALERVMESRESGDQRPALPTMDALAHWVPRLAQCGLSTQLKAYLDACAARAVVAQASRNAPAPELAVSWFRVALQLAPVGPTRSRWLDWPAPGDLGARMRIDAVRVLFPLWKSPQDVQALLGGSGPEVFGAKIDTSSIDQDRLCTALLRLERAQRPIGPLLQKLISAGWKDGTSERSRCLSHREFFPSRIEIALVHAEEGRFYEAMSRLISERQGLESLAISIEGTELVETIQQQIRYRMRQLGDVRLEEGERKMEALTMAIARLGQMRPDLATLSDDQLQQLLRPSEALRPIVPAFRWRATPVLDARHARAATDWAKEALPKIWGSTDPKYWPILGLLDAYEANLVARQYHAARPFGREHEDALVDSLAQFEAEENPALHIPSGLVAAALDLVNWSLFSANMTTRLGSRLIASCAQMQGELLALRLPLNGAFLLGLARNLYRTCGDPIGAFLSGLGETMSLLRAGDQDFEHLISELRHDYGALTEGLVPPWNELVTAFEDPFNFHWASWAGWSDILLWTMMTLCAASPGSDQRHRMAKLVELAQQRLRGGHHQLPTELEALRRLVFRTTERAALDDTESESHRRGLLFEARGVGTPRQTSLNVSLSSEGHQVTASVSLAEPYHVLSIELRPRMRELPSFQQPRSAPLTCLIHPEVAGVCWEAAVTWTLKRDPMSSEMLDIRRIASDAFASRRHPHMQLRSLLWVQPEELGFGSRIAQGFDAVKSTGWRTERIEALGSLVSRRSDSDVLYIAASPISTAHGPRLRNARPSMSMNASTERGEVISATDVHAAVPSAQLCILQSPPMPEIKRSPADRLLASVARAFAGELAFANEALVVLVIPPLPEPLAGWVIETVIPVLKTDAWCDELPAAVRRMRRHILDALGDSLSSFEIAMDVCLYMPDPA